jgi:hypothetical protein
MKRITRRDLIVRHLTFSEAYCLAYCFSDESRALVPDAIRALPSHAELAGREEERQRRRELRKAREVKIP